MAIKLEPLPPQEAIDVFESKGFELSPSFSWRDRFQEDHAASFTVAKAMSADILQTIHDAVGKAIKDGTTFRQFRNELEPKLISAGWWGRREQVDPATGESQLAQLGSPRRLRLIFDVNLRQAHAAGQWARIQRNKESRPYLRYSALLDDRVRPEHAAWDGVVLPVDDPFWETHTPMNGWRCRCSVRQLSEAELRRRGLTVSKRPPTRTRPWRNDRTGQIVDVPEGIDPGFGYNPGAAALEQNAARVFGEKAATWSPDIAASATAASGRILAAAQGEAYRSWLSAARAGRPTPQGDAQVVSVLPQATLDALAARRVQPRSGAVTIKADQVRSILRDSRGGVAAEIVEALPERLADPRAVLRDRKSGDLVYVLGDGQHRPIVRIRVAEQTGSNAVRTAETVSTRDLRSDQIELISGSLD